MDTISDYEVTPERAVLLAMHATYVQGGFSTPEIEKARAEKDMADGGAPINWAKFQAELDAVQAPAEEAEAAELEGLAEMPADLVGLRQEKLLLDAQIEQLLGRKREITDEFSERLKEAGLQGFLLHGKVKARRSEVTTNRVDSKELKAQMPHVWNRFLKVTKSVRINIT